MEQVTLLIDGEAITVPKGTTVREAALQMGVHTPTLCYHPHMHCGSNCRACVVELEGARTLVPSCSRTAAEGMEIQTNSDRVQRSRRMVFELLMTEVDTSAAPELQAYAAHYGASPERFAAAGPRAAERTVMIDNPFFVRDYAKCIACQRCTQACGEDVQHTFAITMIGRGHAISVGAGDGANDLSKSPCVFCGNCVGACPTGALTPLLEFEARQAGAIDPVDVRWSPEAGFEGPDAAWLAHPDRTAKEAS